MESKINIVNGLQFEFDEKTACPTGVPDESYWIFDSDKEIPYLKYDLYMYINSTWQYKGSFISLELILSVAESLNSGLLDNLKIKNLFDMYSTINHISYEPCSCTLAQLSGDDSTKCISCFATNSISSIHSMIQDIYSKLYANRISSN